MTMIHPHLARAGPVFLPLLLQLVLLSLAPACPTAFVTAPPAITVGQQSALAYGLSRAAVPSSGEPPSSVGVAFRRGRASDLPSVFKAMLSERMNPLVLDMSRFLCAVEVDGGERLLGFGQVRPLPGVSDALELASVYVSPEARGRGIGSAVVGKLVQDFRQQHQGGTSLPELYILTLRERSGFYEPHGFVECPVDQAPPVLQTEFRLGRVVTKLSGRGPDALIVMKLLADSSS